MRRLIFATLLALCATPADAQGRPSLSPETYIPLLNVYLARLPDIRATMEVCYPEMIAATEPEEWEKAKASITATLWAANFPPEVSGSPEWLMHPDATGTASECKSPMGADAQGAAYTGWVKFVGFALKSMGLEVITNPPTAESIAEVETILAEETALSARLIGCAAVAAPSVLIPMAADWNDRLLRALVQLAGAGYPRPRLVELADAGNPDLFIKPDDPEALLADCNQNLDWYERYSLFHTAGLTTRINDLLVRTGVIEQ
jgi:hypothetical protein